MEILKMKKVFAKGKILFVTNVLTNELFNIVNYFNP